MYNLFMDADLAQAILESVKPLRSTLISAIPDTLLLLGICTIAYLFTPLTTFHSGLGFDGRFYAAMADRTNSDPLYYLHAPWCWRVLTPSIAALLPFSTISSYQIIAFITCLASLMLLRSILEQQGFESKWQWYGIALYSGVFWTLRWSFYSPAYIDHMGQFLTLLGIWLIQRKYHSWLYAFMFVAALHKESMLLLALVAFAARGQSEQYSKSSKLFLAGLLISGLIGLSLPRVLIVPINEYAPEAAFVAYLTKFLSDPYNWGLFVLAIFSGLGVMPLLILTRPKANMQFLTHHHLWAMLFAVGGLQLLAGSDKPRLFLPMLPAVVTLSVYATREYLHSTSKARFVAAMASLLALHLVLGHHFWPLNRHLDFFYWMTPMHQHTYPWWALARVAIVTVCFIALSNRYIYR